MLKILCSGSSSGQKSVSTPQSGGFKYASQREMPETSLKQICLGGIVKIHILGVHHRPIQLDSLWVLGICIFK